MSHGTTLFAVMAWQSCFAFANPAEPGDAVCRRASGKITLDGKAEDPAWKAAEEIAPFRVPWTNPPKAALTKTKARLLWDDEALYFFAEMDDADLFADVEEHDGVTWDNDVFELFFKPREDEKPYYEFQVTPKNTHFDCCLLTGTVKDVQRWKSKHEFTWETKPLLRGTLNERTDEDRGWSVEGKIPWSDFRHTGGKPKPGDVWKFALCRYDYCQDFDGPDLSTTAPLTQRNYHQTENYGRLTFSEK